MEEINIKKGDLLIKTRRGMKQKEKLVADIYNLSLYYLDKIVNESINEIFTINIKPSEFIKEKNKVSEDTCQFNKIRSETSNKEKENMTNNDEVLQTILQTVQSLKSQVDNISKNQEQMQAQLDLNTESIYAWNNKIIDSTDVMEEEQSKINTSSSAPPSKKLKANNGESKTPRAIWEGHAARKPARSSTVKNGSNEKKVKTIVTGTKTHTNIKAATRTFDVFVGNLDLSTTDKNILDMFSSNNIQIGRYMEIATRMQRAKAYRVRIDYDDKEKVFDPSLWPKDIKLSKFFVRENMHNDKPSTSPKAKANGEIRN